MVVSQNKWRDVGFTRNEFVKQTEKGLLLGAPCFAVVYSIECIILYIVNGDVALGFYVSRFSLNGEMAQQTEIQFVP